MNVYVTFSHLPIVVWFPMLIDLMVYKSKSYQTLTDNFFQCLTSSQIWFLFWLAVNEIAKINTIFAKYLTVHLFGCWHKLSSVWCIYGYLCKKCFPFKSIVAWLALDGKAMQWLILLKTRHQQHQGWDGSKVNDIDTSTVYY